jgi:hypothetical protein
MARKTRRARKTRKQRGGFKQNNPMWKEHKTPNSLQGKCAECFNTSSKTGFCNLSTCGNYCAIERGGLKTKWNTCKGSNACLRYMKPEPYVRGKSRIVVEDSIVFVEPEGEICYGDTITTCTTVTVVFDDNSKIGLHINPMPLYLREAISNSTSTPEPIITYENIWNKISELREINNKIRNAVKAVYIISSPELNIYDNYKIRSSNVNDGGSLITKGSMTTILETKLPGFSRGSTNFIYQTNITLEEYKYNDHHLVIRADGRLEGRYKRILKAISLPEKSLFNAARLERNRAKPENKNKDKKIVAAKAALSVLEAAQAKWKTENPDPQLIIDSNGERAYPGD